MPKHFLSIVFLFVFAISSFAQEKGKYASIFDGDYNNAIKYMTENKLLQTKILADNGIKPEILLPVIFPERIRYSIVKDYFETEILEVVYVRYGAEYADFSIGDFQIKASFAEIIEAQIDESQELSKKYSLLIIKAPDEKEERRVRTYRLQNTAYQLYYLSAFYDIVNSRFDLTGKTVKEKIQFISSAYNHGFTDTKKEIERYSGLKFFPYGDKYPGEQYSYSDVALDFYIFYFADIYR